MYKWQGVTSVAVMSDDRIVSGSWDGTIRVWNTKSGESRVLTRHTGGVRRECELMYDDEKAMQ